MSKAITHCSKYGHIGFARKIIEEERILDKIASGSIPLFYAPQCFAYWLYILFYVVRVAIQRYITFSAVHILLYEYLFLFVSF